LVLFPQDDHPGGLLEILAEFANQGINLERLESRPTGDGLGQYCFSIDAEGHINDQAMGAALMGLRALCADIRYLGSYPRAHSTASSDRRAPRTGSGVDSVTWLEQLRQGHTS
jgi:prephenate dehydratase